MELNYVGSPHKMLTCTLEYSTEDGTPQMQLTPTGNATYVALAHLTSEQWVLVILRGGSGGSMYWEVVPQSYGLGITEDTVLTVAIVNGISYFYLSGIGAFVYDEELQSISSRDLIGLDPVAIQGIVASQGYMLAWTDDAISWSSVVNVEDFEPSDITGAGGGNIQEIEGRIIVCRATYLGFIIYASENAVSVTYSGNEDYPWVFKAIPSSGGVRRAEDVSKEETGGYQHAYTGNGIQQISHQRANTVMPHITDFVSGNVFEDFDPTTDTFTQVKLGANQEMPRGLAVIADRYLIVSYSRPNFPYFTHAVVVDLIQQRMGKLKFPHYHVFERIPIFEEGTVPVKASVAFIHPDTDIYVLDFNPLYDADGVVLLGKFQVRRSNLVELQEVTVEGLIDFEDRVEPEPVFHLLAALPEEPLEPESKSEVRAVASLDGKNPYINQKGFRVEEGEGIQKFLFNGIVGQNYSVMLKGNFDLIGFTTVSNIHGRR